VSQIQPQSTGRRPFSGREPCAAPEAPAKGPPLERKVWTVAEVGVASCETPQATARGPPERHAWTLNEFCAAFRISRSALYAMINDGTLRTVIIGGRRLVPASEGERLLQNGTGMPVRRGHSGGISSKRRRGLMAEARDG
jgi:hypothetical protein